MYLLYSIVYSLGFLLMVPAFLLNRAKYAPGFRERLGNYPEFKQDGRKVIWLHCVSVGETNAARPLVDKLVDTFPDHRLVVSTTTRTGQELAKKIFAEKAAAIVYFPFDYKFSVRRAIHHFKPSLVLLMETEIWPRFIHEGKLSGAKVSIVNGRLSETSYRRYSKFRSFISRVVNDIDLALMQGEQDSRRIVSLGLPETNTFVTGNLKFDLKTDENESRATKELDERFAFTGARPVIAAASTHEPEELWILAAYCSLAADDASRPRLLIAPRHPERFDFVTKTVNEFRDDSPCEWNAYTIVRRSDTPHENDKDADVVLLDSIGELRAIFPLSEIVFVGGSLIPHGGQSVLEPAAAGKAIVTGPFMENFEEVVRIFKANKALIQLPEMRDEVVGKELFLVFSELLENEIVRHELGRNALAVMAENQGATARTIEWLRPLITGTNELKNSNPKVQSVV